MHPAESLWRMRRTRPVSSSSSGFLAASLLLLLPASLLLAEGGRGRSSRCCGLGGVDEGLSLLLPSLLAEEGEATEMEKREREKLREKEGRST